MKTDFFTIAFLFLALFSFSGWYFAETDNEILRQELSAYTGKELRK